MSEANKDLVRDFYAKVINDRGVGAADRLLAPGSRLGAHQGARQRHP